jgi:hypothetical protein
MNVTKNAAPLRLLAIMLLLGVGLSGCQSRLNMLRDVRAVGFAAARPEPHTIAERSARPLRVYRVEMAPNAARLLKRLESSVYLTGVPCGTNNKTFEPDIIEEIYIDGRDMSHGEDHGEDIDSNLRRNSGHLIGFSYLKEADAVLVPQLCFQISGGTMYGFSFSSNKLRVANPENRAPSG